MPPPDNFRVLAHFRPRSLQRRNRTGRIIRLALPGGEDVPLRPALAEAAGRNVVAEGSPQTKKADPRRDRL